MQLNTHPDHVFLIVADSLRNDVANTEMSFVNELAANGIQVTNCYSLGPGTPSSMAGMIQSRLPIDHNGYGLSLPPSPPTLAEWLSRNGIATAGYHSNAYTTADAGFGRGFDDFRNLRTFDGLGDMEEESNQNGQIGWREQAREFTDRLGILSLAEQAIKPLKRWGYMDADPRADGEDLFAATRSWLSDQESDRTFTWLQLMDTHLPYLPPEDHRPDEISFREMYDLWQSLISRPDYLSESEIARLKDLYRAEARHIDELLADFVDHLRDTGRWESTVLIITGDHGELFGDRSVPGDAAPVKHLNYLCEELTHVPLVIAGGALTSSETISTLTSGLDIAPTVSQLVGYSPSDGWRGEIIGTEAFKARDQVVSTVAHTRGQGVSYDQDALHVAVRTEDRAVLWWRQDHDPEYYLRIDGGEKRIDEAEADPDAFESLLETAHGMVGIVDEVSDEGDAGGEVSQRLRDLGYVE